MAKTKTTPKNNTGTPDIINKVTKTVDPATLKEHPRNPRKGNLELVKESIRAHGFFGTILVQESTGYVLAGNHRLRAAQALGMTEVPAVFVDVTDEMATRILIADNRTSDVAEYDNETLANLLADLQGTEAGLNGLGFDDLDLAALLDELEPETPPEPAERPTGDPKEILERHGFNGTFGKWTIHTGDAEQVVPTLPGDLFDAVVCDPPYGIDFMGRGWDHSVPGPDLWRAVYDKLKPGAHVFAFGGTREWHHLAVALEDAGFTIRDCIVWAYGTGFPKSHDPSKAIDKHLGATREKIRIDAKNVQNPKASGGGKTKDMAGASRPFIERAQELGYHEMDGNIAVTPEADHFSGFGSALKPSWEPCIVARKPLEGTLAANAIKHNTGAIWVDGGRVPSEESWEPVSRVDKGGVTFGGKLNDRTRSESSEVGRWPANMVIDQSAAQAIDAQAGGEVSRFFTQANFDATESGNSRLLYTAKAPSDEREAGLDHLSAGPSIFGGEGGGFGNMSNSVTPRANTHTTVKPIELTKWLATLALTPRRPGFPRRVLVPFSGVASEMLGCLLAGWDEVVGVEITPEYVEIAKERIKAYEQAAKDTAKVRTL
jgi:site-specific DNA-methyltransferase (adenine-specific)